MARRILTPQGREYPQRAVGTVTIARCPECNEHAPVYRNCQVRGSGRLVWNFNGELQPARLKSANFEPYSELIRCLHCKKIRHDLFADGEEVRGAGE